jgi:hypothetical protein
MSNSRRVCDSKMKKAYSKPKFRELSRTEGIRLFGDRPPKIWPIATERFAHKVRFCRLSTSRN